MTKCLLIKRDYQVLLEWSKFVCSSGLFILQNEYCIVIT